MSGVTTHTMKGARLDKALCNLEWHERFLEASVVYLPRIGSDHCPVLVHMYIQKAKNCNNPFKFQLAWLTHPKFEDLVKDHWVKDNTLEDNSERLSHALKYWNRNEFVNIFKIKQRLEAKIVGIQKCLDASSNRGLLKLDMKLRKELDEVLLQDEIMCF